MPVLEFYFGVENLRTDSKYIIINYNPSYFTEGEYLSLEFTDVIGNVTHLNDFKFDGSGSQKINIEKYIDNYNNSLYISDKNGDYIMQLDIP